MQNKYLIGENDDKNDDENERNVQGDNIETKHTEMINDSNSS